MFFPRTEKGFIQSISNGIIDTIECDINTGIAYINYSDGKQKELYINCDGYNWYNGTPVSKDSSKLFISSWDDGVSAYCLKTGELLWNFRKTQMAEIFVFDSYLVVYRQGKSIYILDLETGELLKAQNGAFDGFFCLDDEHLLLIKQSRKSFLLKPQNFEIIKKYNVEQLNPNGCFSIVITKAYVEHTKIMISGFEEYPNGDYGEKDTKVRFNRVLDENYL